MTSNAMKADTPTSTERMEELISPPLDRNRVVSQHVPETCLTLRHKSTLIETQISNTHSEEPESSPRRMLEIILLIMVKRREEMPSPRLGMSHGTVEILPRHHAVAQVPSILVPPMPMTLVIDSKTSMISEHGNISPRKLLTGTTAILPHSEYRKIHTQI